MKFKWFKWDKIKKRITYDALTFFLVYYGFALILLFSTFFFNNFSKTKFFSDFLAWSFTLLIPNIYLFTLYQFSIGQNIRTSLFRMMIAWALAIVIFSIFLLFNLATKFRDFVDPLIVIVIIVIAITNLRICYILARPFAKDIMDTKYIKRFEGAKKVGATTSKMADELRQEEVE